MQSTPVADIGSRLADAFRHCFQTLITEDNCICGRPEFGCLIIGLGSVDAVAFAAEWAQAIGAQPPAEGACEMMLEVLSTISANATNRLRIVAAPASATSWAAELLATHEPQEPATILLIDAAKAAEPSTHDMRMLLWIWRRRFPQLPLEVVRQIAAWLPLGMLREEQQQLLPLLASIAIRHGPCFQASVVLCNTDGLLARIEQLRAHGRSLSDLCGGGELPEGSPEARPKRLPRGGPYSVVLTSGAPTRVFLLAPHESPPVLDEEEQPPLAKAARTLHACLVTNLQVSLDRASATVVEKASAAASRSTSITTAPYVQVTSPPTYVLSAPELFKLKLLSPSARAGLIRAVDAAIASNVEGGGDDPLWSREKKVVDEPLSLVAWVMGRAQFASVGRKGFFAELAELMESGRISSGGSQITSGTRRAQGTGPLGGWAEVTGPLGRTAVVKPGATKWAQDVQ